MIITFLKFIICSILIVIISKNILATTLRKLAQSMNLKSKTVGNIAGIATSVPELLSLGIAGFTGLIDTGIFNILSSNVINVLEYFLTVKINGNIKKMKNKVIIIELIIVLITIIIPVIIYVKDIELNFMIIIIFLLLFCIFSITDSKIHKKYLEKENEIEKEQGAEGKDKKQILKYIIILIGATILIFITGNILSDSLETLCNNFGVSQIIIGILLGVITSAPEFITFNEAQKYHKKESKEQLKGVIEATNNLISSNMLNLLVIQSIGILIYLISY
jgi:Ca2+/Na+ antiporter